MFQFLFLEDWINKINAYISSPYKAFVALLSICEWNSRIKMDFWGNICCKHKMEKISFSQKDEEKNSNILR